MENNAKQERGSISFETHVLLLSYLLILSITIGIVRSRYLSFSSLINEHTLSLLFIVLAFVLQICLITFFYKKFVKEQSRALGCQLEKERLQNELFATAYDFKQSKDEIQSQIDEIILQNSLLADQNNEINRQNDEIEKYYHNLHLIGEFGQSITSSLNFEEIQETVYTYIKSMLRFTSFGIGIHNVYHKNIVYSKFYLNDQLQPIFSESLTEKDKMANWCLKNKKELLLYHFKKEFQEYIEEGVELDAENANQSQIFVPLLVQDKTIGVMTVQHKHKNAYNQTTLSNIKTLAAYVAIAIDNSDAYRILHSQNENIISSIRYASRIQEAILPEQSVVAQYFDSFILNRPKDIVSGDFFWFTTVKSEYAELIFAAVVDCTGHGVPGAFMSMIGSRLLSEIVNIRKIYSPCLILENLKAGIAKALNQTSCGSDGMDVCLCRFEKIKTIDESYTQVIFSGAKRPLYWFEAGEQCIRTIKGDKKQIGMVNRFLEDTPYINHRFNMKAGDVVYLTSDGFIDQPNKNKKSYGSKKLVRSLLEVAALPMETQAERIEQSLWEHQGEEVQRDDITIWGLRLSE